MIRLVTCTSCGDEAVYFRPYSGERYCQRCYIHAIEKQVQRTISRYRMLKPNHTIALALSGGKDSVSLLHILNKIEKDFSQSKLVAVTIDEGIAGYRAEAIDIAKENCAHLQVEHHVFSFKKLYHYTLDEIVEAAKRKDKVFICKYCGILRRKALNIAAREVGATRLATAHNLDDEVQSMVMNLLRGDVARLSIPTGDIQASEGMVPRIKPFYDIPEKDVALYAFFKKLRFQSFFCNYLDTSLRGDVRKFLNTIEEKHPGMKLITHRSFEKIQPFIPLQHEKEGTCILCGEPTTRETCMACQILKDLDCI